MFFNYPSEAIQNNWIHNCIVLTIENICQLLDQGEEIKDCSSVIPQEYFERLKKKRKVKELFIEFGRSASAVSSENRKVFVLKLKQQNNVAGLLDGTVEVPVFGDGLKFVLESAKAIFDEGFSLLSKMEIRAEHYKIIYEKISHKTCPFCGMEPFDAPGQASEDEDHYLARSHYPLAAANFENLVPMGGKCNQRYKGQENVLYSNGDRRKAIYPYGTVVADISLENSIPMSNGLGNPQWIIDVNPDIEEIRTWESIFSIKSRLENSVFDPNFDNWLSALPDWFSHSKLDESASNDDVIYQLEQLMKYSRKHRGQGQEFFKDKVYEFLLVHCRQGNLQLLAMIRAALPTKVIA